jgi:putative ABC transport system ATP-binding protein
MNVASHTASSAGGAAPIIELVALNRTYRTEEVEVRAVRDVSLTIERGEFVAIMGASGSGKSTLMNVLGCLDRPTSGEYRLAGRNVAELERSELALLRNRKIGFVFQSFNLLARTSALENVELPLLYSVPLVPQRERRARATRTLESVGLAARMQHVPSRLSGGQQQRVAIARALVTAPELLLADEPTGNLDSRTSIDIMGLLQAQNDAGLTVVMVTHELDIAAYCKRIVVMRDGEIIRDEANAERRSAAAERAALDAAEQQARLA